MVSPRGFGNEGTYIYGTGEEMDKVYESLDYENGNRWYDMTKHKTLENAKKASEKKQRNTGDEITENYTSVMSAEEYHYVW